MFKISHIQDLKNIINDFLDVKSLNYFLQINKVSKKYNIAKALLKKKKQCKSHWHFHLNNPDLVQDLKTLSNITQHNLDVLKSKSFIWQNTANIWLIPRGNVKTAKDIMIRGYHPEKGNVQYWRHETKNPGSGSTLLIWDENGKRKNIQVHKFIKN